MLKIYGLKNCDTCRKALKWLAAENIAHDFIDLRADGVSRHCLKSWLQKIGAEKLINKSSTSWRGLSDAQKQGISEANMTDSQILDVLVQHITLVKRPIFDNDAGFCAVGFKADTQDALKQL